MNLLPTVARSRRERLIRTGAWWALTLVGLALVWPASRGTMPLSADHTVHLTRAVMFAETLSRGHLHGWSAVWFFGTPVGELYPILGDFIVIALRWGSGTLLSWPAAYALTVALAFLSPAWALWRAGNCLGYGPSVGFVAGLLALLDVGAYREGGWVYTIDYGVWPQTLATALTWWSIAELGHACSSPGGPARGRRIAVAASASGLALLAHPMTLLTLLVAAPLVLVALHRDPAVAFRTRIATTIAVALLGVGLSLAWLGPMLQHRAWMASYGWLWLPLSKMLAEALRGAWSEGMPPLVGHAISLGLLVVLLRGRPLERAYAAIALVLWILAARDVAWTLRLDRLSEGFTHLQYQRFITSAKPGLFLVAAVPIGMLAQAARSRAGRPMARLLQAGSLMGAAGIAIVGVRTFIDAPTAGRLQLERMPGTADFETHYRALAQWLDAQSTTRETPWGVTVIASRNQHWFMDLPTLTHGIPLYKQGFTPGDNFVHKPESGHATILERARVRYVISLRSRRGAVPVATFGPIHVYERPSWAPIAWLEGSGSLEILEQGLDHGPIRVRVRDSDATTRLTFGIAGYPRWRLEGPGGPLAWLEAPILGPGRAIDPALRRSGALRGGHARGNDGREPTLIQAPVQDGDYTLRYAFWTLSDLGWLAGTLVSLALLAGLRWPPPWGQRIAAKLDHRVQRIASPRTAVALAAILAGFVSWRYLRAIRRSEGTAVSYAQAGDAVTFTAMKPDFLKTDMLIRPALVVARRHRDPATFELPGLPAEAEITGWVALDDDEAQLRTQGRHRVELEVRASGGAWTSILSLEIPNRPGLIELAPALPAFSAETFDLRLRIATVGHPAPRLGFDLVVHPRGRLEGGTR